MAQSYTAVAPGSLACQPPRVRRKVLVTGAAGSIGAYFAEHSHASYDLRLMVRVNEDAARIEAIRNFGEVVSGDLADLPRLKELCRGVDTVVHLAAVPSPEATWDELLPANIIGTYNAMIAAKSAGCRRVIYASSIHAVSGYPPDVQVKTNEPVNPGDLYGVTKCFGEAMGRYMAEQEGLSVIALRIGAFQPPDVVRDEQRGIALMDMWVSLRDLNQLIERCIDVETLRFAILHGLSDSRFKRYDITDARELVGYMPQDDVTKIHPGLAALNLTDRIMRAQSHDAGQKSGIRDDV